MARYRISDQPISRLALWARRIAVFALPAALLAIVIVRSGMLEIWPALMTFGGALALAVAAMVLALAAFVVIWREGIGGAGAAFPAIAIGIVLLAYPGYSANKATSRPQIADTPPDPIDPPRFEAIARLRTRETNPPNYAGLYAAEQQRIAYPDVEALEVSSNAQQTYDAALAIITKRHWLIVDARPPQANRRDGRIDAVAYTPVMGFRDDIVVRVRATRDGSRLDVRSASRYGRHDFGTNASRIVSLTSDIDDALDALNAEKRPKPVQKAKAGQAQGKAQPAKR